MKNIRLILTITIIVFLGTVNTIAKTIVTDDLVGYWTFDQGTILGRTVKDVWGENDATLVGNPKSVEGYVKSGLELDGEGDYVSLPNIGNFGSKIGEYTFEVWFKTTQKDRWSAIYRVLEQACGKFQHGTGILLNGRFAIGGGPLRKDVLTVQDAITFERNHIKRNACGGSASGRRYVVSDGKWHQIVYTTQPITEEDKEKFRQFRRNFHKGCLSSDAYIDTEQIAGGGSCSSPPDFLAYIEPIFLGAVNNMGKASGFFEGVFDEVRIYDRALTHEEVIRNYESGIGLGVEAVEKLPTVWGALKERR